MYCQNWRCCHEKYSNRRTQICACVSLVSAGFSLRARVPTAFVSQKGALALSIREVRFVGESCRGLGFRYFFFWSRLVGTRVASFSRKGRSPMVYCGGRVCATIYLYLADDGGLSRGILMPSRCLSPWNAPCAARSRPFTSGLSVC